MTQYKISGVPTFVVGGKYQTSEADAGGAQPLFQTPDKLIDGERKALALLPTRNKQLLAQPMLLLRQIFLLSRSRRSAGFALRSADPNPSRPCAGFVFPESLAMPLLRIDLPSWPTTIPACPVASNTTTTFIIRAPVDWRRAARCFLPATSCPPLAGPGALCDSGNRFRHRAEFPRYLGGMARRSAALPATAFHCHRKHPFRAADLQQLYRQWPELAAQSEQLLACWPMLTPGCHRLEFEQGRIKLLTLILDDADGAENLAASVDAIYLDGFAPARNPGHVVAACLQSVGPACAPAHHAGDLVLPVPCAKV